MALRDEIERIQEVLKINERSMRSPDRELFHSILAALRDIEEDSRPGEAGCKRSPTRRSDPAHLTGINVPSHAGIHRPQNHPPPGFVGALTGHRH